ncbi:hypothetical protein [Xenorhabdus miraniensis]|uniref:Uncharacterized protein n=1 Tax=Xenorhabdus miraniensis TaxID=351674 RepID=A0A2D0JLH1_9GAMM|nr:hypothetical protein [Xenorhabdus miraniensis]PHM47150.1 hypothetical protein Xmir_03572 [Xenorhabdus miraniensis]
MNKKMLGVNVLPLVVMLHQARRWWTLRKLRSHWRQEQKFAKRYRQHKWARGVFNIEWNYWLLKISARAKQEQGVI